MSIKAKIFWEKVNRKDELAGRLTAVQGKTRKRCMTVIRTAGLLMLGLVCSALLSNPVCAQSKEAQWEEFKKAIKQDCRYVWHAHKAELVYESKDRFVNEQCWSGVQKASTWTSTGGQLHLTLKEILCSPVKTKIKLDYHFKDGTQAETCV